MRLSNVKVHPTENSNRPFDSLSEPVSQIVLDIETELSQLNSNHDAEFDHIYGQFRERPAPQNLHGASTYQSLAQEPANRVTTKRRVVTDDEESKDVKFSHELLESDSKIASELHEKFDSVAAQTEEYRRRYLEATEKLREAHARLGEAEAKLDAADDENLRLRAEAKTGGATGLAQPRVGGGGPTQQEADMNKRSEQIRKALLSGEGDTELGVSIEALLQSPDLLSMLRGWLLLHLPFRRDLRQIQAKFGSSIASYFTFMRFLFLQMCGVAALMALLGVLHLVDMARRTRSVAAYVVNRLGYMPSFMVFSTFRTNERLLYSTVLVVTLVYLVVGLCVKIVGEDKRLKQLAAVETENNSPYSKEVLCAWDFSLARKAEADDLSGTLGNQFLQLLEYTRSRGVKKTRSNYELVQLYSRRVLGLYLYLYVLFVSSGLIVYLTINAKYISSRASSTFLSTFSALITPFILTAINAVIPTLLEFITAMERWDSVQIELNTLLFRVYVSSTLNSLILALSYLLLVDPMLFASHPDLRKSLQLPVNSSFPCRYDQAADGLFTLVIFTWVLNLLMVYAMPVAMRLYSELLARKPWVKSEFNVAESMVKVLNLLGLVFMSLPFAPLTLLFAPLFLLVTFKWEKYCVKMLYAKPKRIGAGQKAGLSFTLFYLCTFLLLGASMGLYFLSSKTLVKSCAIQDDHVGLCASDLVNDVCSLDTGSQYYSLFAKASYPAELCSQACGAFVDSASNVEPFKQALLGVDVLRVVWVALFDYPYVPWLAAVVLALAVAMTVNSLDVQRLSAYSRQRVMETHINTIDAERKRQEKTIRKLKTIEEEAGAGPDDVVDF